MRNFTRVTLRLVIFGLLMWGFVQSCVWMGSMTATRDRYQGYPYYSKPPYTSTYDYEEEEEVVDTTDIADYY